MEEDVDVLDGGAVSEETLGPCSDMLICTSDGRGGWLCHENAHTHLLGTIAQTIDWVCSELLANRCPEHDYGWEQSASPQRPG